MSRLVNVYSENDIKKFIKQEIEKKFEYLDDLINTLHQKVVDLDIIIRGSK